MLMLMTMTVTRTTTTKKIMTMVFFIIAMHTTSYMTFIAILHYFT